MSGRQRRLTALVSGLATAAILLLFANAGDVILESFGITVEAFQVLGGLVVLLIALDMLGLLGVGTVSYGGGSDEPNPLLTEVFPMAVPLFTGPGAITAVMIYSIQGDGNPWHDLHVSIVVLVISAAVAAGFLLASTLSRVIGLVTQQVLNRLLGVIVGAMGIEFILDGIAGFYALPTASH
jgi:multiple antibiotic resistance protein